MKANRRAFFKFIPLGLSFAAAPVVASATTVLCRTADDPMRGTYKLPMPSTGGGILAGAPFPAIAPRGEWSMIRICKTKDVDEVESEYVSSHMERRPDGKYVLVYDREK